MNKGISIPGLTLGSEAVRRNVSDAEKIHAFAGRTIILRHFKQPG